MKTNVPSEQEAGPSNATPETDDTQCSPRQLARRRILKAAAGAPVVLTVNAGSAQANGSLGCVNDSIDRANEVFPATVEETAPDRGDWVRVQVMRRRYEHNGFNGNGKYTEGYRIPDTDLGKWYRVSGKGDDDVQVEPHGVESWAEVVTTDHYYLLADYPSGNPIAGGSSTGTPIAGGSCWASMAVLGFPDPR